MVFNIQFFFYFIIFILTISFLYDLIYINSESYYNFEKKNWIHNASIWKNPAYNCVPSNGKPAYTTEGGWSGRFNIKHPDNAEEQARNCYNEAVKRYGKNGFESMDIVAKGSKFCSVNFGKPGNGKTTEGLMHPNRQGHSCYVNNPSAGTQEILNQAEIDKKIAQEEAQAQKRLQDSLKREREAHARMLAEKDSAARAELARQIEAEKSSRNMLLSNMDKERAKLLALKDAESKKLLSAKDAENKAAQEANLKLERENALLKQKIEAAKKERVASGLALESQLGESSQERAIAEQERKDLDARLKNLQDEWTKKNKLSQAANLKISDSLELAEKESKELELALNAEIQKFENERMRREALNLELIKIEQDEHRLKQEHSMAVRQQQLEHDRKKEEDRKRLQAMIDRENAEKERMRLEKEKNIAELEKQKLEKEARIRQQEYDAKVAAERRRIEIAEENARALEEAIKLARSKDEVRALTAAKKNAEEEIVRLNETLQKTMEDATREKVALQLKIDGLKAEIIKLKLKLKNTENELEDTEKRLYNCSLYTKTMQRTNVVLHN